MIHVGQRERATQNRIVKLFRERLHYAYLGNLADREDNRNVITAELRAFLVERGYSPALIERALHELDRTAGDQTKHLYDLNKAVYTLLRYGVKIREELGQHTQTVWLIDWEHPLQNHFAIAEEVTIRGATPHASTKRPDLVLYVNGIALGVIELKRSIVSLAEGIRQNLDNQKPEFIQPFFATIQWVMAGSDSQGLRYGVIGTREKYYLTWKEANPGPDLPPLALDQHLLQLCEPARFLEIIHNFIVFDAGTKKLCRPNQYFGVRAAQEFIKRRQGGIIWHTQGSGKSLTMVWLAKWIRENVPHARILIVTDRTELDDQIEKVFLGVNEAIARTRSGADLIAWLNATIPPLICSLIHKFGGREDAGTDIPGYIDELKRALPPGFKPKGDLYVFVDECHRTQSGELHKAMKAILPDAVLIGFTGTPLLKADKQKSIEIFGPYIHTYKFDEAVKDGVVLDLRYEARDIQQYITSPGKIDQWFEAQTQGLTDLARAQLKQRWGTLQTISSSRDRLEMIAADILMDMARKPRLMDGHGNAMLVAGSIYQACKFYELFESSPLGGKCAIITSYAPAPADIKGEESGEGLTEKLRQYNIYRKMLAAWFREPEESAVNKVERFEKEVKEKFIAEPGQMKLLIVVDKLLTGFDAPPATYLYIDKHMRDHGLFQAICRVNRLDGEDKEYGYIVDYKDLFQSLDAAIHDYTSGALDGYDPADVAGLLSDRLEKAREHLEETREAVKALCEPVAPPKDTPAYLHYFCGDTSKPTDLKDREPERLALYRHTAALLRAYANLANELPQAGYSPTQIATLQAEVDHFESVRTEVKLASRDYIDLKLYEPAMRHLIDTYIRAEDSRKVSAFDDISLVQLIVERGVDAIGQLPAGIRGSQTAVAETIENNVRRLIIDETPINPRYYDQMSELLDALIAERKRAALSYQDYLAQIAALAKRVVDGGDVLTYPTALNTPARRALYDNLQQDEIVALAVDEAILRNRQDDWRNNPIKVKLVRKAVKTALGGDEELTHKIMELVKNQYEY